MDEKELLGADIFLASEYVAIFQYLLQKKYEKDKIFHIKCVY
jgi:hypothetical protein